MIEKTRLQVRRPIYLVAAAVSSMGISLVCPTFAATIAPPPASANPPISPPLYVPGADALARAAAASPAAQAQALLAERCKKLLATGTPVERMPAECKPYLPPVLPPAMAIAPSLFSYVPNLAALRPGGATPPPPSGAQTLPGDPVALKKYCETLLARGWPYSQLPAECRRVLPDPAATAPSPAPAPNAAGVPMCPDPTVFTHVRMIPCPPAPSAAVPPPSGQRMPTPSPTPTPPSSRPPAPPAPVAQPPVPPAPPPVAQVPPAPTPAPTPTPATPVAPPIAPSPIPAPPPVVRAPASQIPIGGGNAGVMPLSLPPPRAATPPPAPAPGPVQLDPNEFEVGEVVIFAPFAQSATGALEVIANAGGTVLLQENLAALEGVLLRVRANDGDAPRLAQILRAQLPQAAVDLHGRLFLFPLSGSPGQGGAPRHYARAMMQFPSSPPALLREMRVGVIDSGVERVGALKNGVASEKSFLPNEQSPADSVHGTAVASLIAGQDERAGFSGAAPGAKLFVARAMSNLPDGRTYTNAVSVLQALNWLVSERVPIVNMSLGGKGDATLALGIAQAIRRGTTIVAAAGNSGPSGAASFPAALPDVVAVTAVDVEAKLYREANRGDYVMVAAPGVDVWAPQRDGGGSYVSGTSFASAWVSGALAYVAATSPALDANSRLRLADVICRSARDLGKSGRDNEFGCGLLQVSSLLDATKTSR